MRTRRIKLTLSSTNKAVNNVPAVSFGRVLGMILTFLGAFCNKSSILSSQLQEKIRL